MADPPPPLHDVHITQKELGEIANASHDVVNWVLNRFEARLWVAIGYSRITIIATAGLAAFADDDSD